METRFQTNSFIPKASLDNVVDDRGKLQRPTGVGTGGTSLFLLLSFFIFICSLVSAGIVFSLNKIDVSRKKAANDSLARSQQSINKETIEDIKSLNNRLTLIKSLTEKHVATSIVFEELAKNTIRQVSFSGFDLKKRNDGTYALTLKAQGIGYESIVAQDSQFSTGQAQRVFKNTSISDFIKSKGQDLTSFTIETSLTNNSVLLSEAINKIK